MRTASPVGRTRVYLRLLLAALALSVAAVAVPGEALAGPAEDAGTSVALINDTRWAHGLHGLMPDRELQIIANRQANRMAQSGSIYHSSDLGSQLSWGWWAWSENVGYGPSVGGIQNAFMNSGYHSSTILNSSFNSVGVGAAYGRDGTVYVAKVFGAW